MAQESRLKRRMAGVLKARLPELGLEEVPDSRGSRGLRWKLATLLKAVLAGLMAGCQSLALVEALTDEMSLAMRKMLRIPRRVPDTTMRDALVRIAPWKLRRCLRGQIRIAHRRKALAPVELPMGQMAIDGKVTAIEATSGLYVQVPKGNPHGLLRTQTASLVTAAARPCVDAVPIPPNTNEMGNYGVVLRGLHRHFGRTNLFGLVSGDAGVCSLANASLTRELGCHYLFALKDNQPELMAEANRLLGSLAPEEALATTQEPVGPHLEHRRLYLTSDLAGYLDWEHLHTVLRVERLVVHRDTGELVSHDNRYFLSSLPSGRLTMRQWLRAVRNHWGVENNCHQTWDAVFQEDRHPWITKDSQGALAVLILRRIAYNMLTLFRSVTQRSEARRSTPWRTLLRWLYNTLIAASEHDIAELRNRRQPVCG